MGSIPNRRTKTLARHISDILTPESMELALPLFEFLRQTLSCYLVNPLKHCHLTEFN